MNDMPLPLSIRCVAVVMAVALPVSVAKSAGERSSSGFAVAKEYCAMCHAVGRATVSPNPLAPPFRSLGNLYDLNELGDILQRGMLFAPHPAMPTFKLDRSRAKALIRYLRSIQE
jgi:mono/diheme cytochrome c family protein